LERQAIVELLSNYDPDRREVDDGTIVKTAREIWGLNGGGKIKAAKEIVKKIASGRTVSSAVSGAKSGAIGGACAAAGSNLASNTKTSILKEAAIGAVSGALDGKFRISEKAVGHIANAVGAASGGFVEKKLEGVRSSIQSQSSNNSSQSKSSEKLGMEVTTSLLSSGCSGHIAALCGALAAGGCNADAISAIAQSVESDYSDE
jgi:hypothetical protein